MINFERVMVMILILLMGRWLCGTGSVSNSTESGGLFLMCFDRYYVDVICYCYCYSDW